MRKLITLFLPFYSLSLNLSVSHAMEQWPYAVRPTVLSFGSHQRIGFADAEGLTDPTEILTNPNQYQWLNPLPAWKPRVRGCDQGRGGGYFHTFSAQVAREENVKVAFPLRFIYRTPWVSEQRRHFLDLPLFRLSIFEEPPANQEDQNGPALLEEQWITLGQIQAQSEAPLDDVDPLSIEFHSILMSAPVAIPANTRFHIRLEWNFDLLCGESHSEFQIGDQIRLIRL